MKNKILIKYNIKYMKTNIIKRKIKFFIIQIIVKNKFKTVKL